MKKTLLLIMASILALNLSAQLAFSSQSVSTTGEYKMCVVDMNGDFLDDIVSVDEYNINVLMQNEDGSFNVVNYPSSPMASHIPEWTMAAGDFNADGYNDLVYGGYTGVTFMLSNGLGTGYTTVTPGNYIFSQRTNFVDINNDGHLDAFICHDEAPNVYFLNDGSNGLEFYQGGLGDYPSGGNYGSVWVDYNNDGLIDMFIAKCGGTEARYTDQLFRNNGDGTFTDVAEEANMDNKIQTWSSAWADYDNDGDMDAFIGASSSLSGWHLLMRNNGDGTFTDVTAGSGFDSFYGTSLEHAPADFNNDGYVDIFGNSGYVFINNGNMTFTTVSVPFSAAAIGDLNNDGFLDAFAFGMVHYNNGNTNNWLTINTIGTESNRNGIGARVELYSAMGKQIRDVRSGEGFARMSTLNTHFGIGSDTAIEKVIVRWPSGIVDLIENPDVNTTLVIVEGDHQMGINDFNSNIFSIYPNPVKDVLHVQAKSTDNADYEIYHLAGQLVKKGQLNNGNINVSLLNKGVYVISIVQNGKKSSLKFIKQ